MSAFRPAVLYVLENEGGYSNYPGDPGGPTNFGITQKDMPDIDTRKISQDDAIRWYEVNRWNKAPWASIEDQSVCTKLFDAAVNNGARTAVMLAQHVLSFRGDAIDGGLGPVTVGAINRDDPAAFLEDFVEALVLHYKVLEQHNPKLTIFDHGWMVRARKLPPVPVAI
jgi:lysozyme family protein